MIDLTVFVFLIAASPVVLANITDLVSHQEPLKDGSDVLCLPCERQLNSLIQNEYKKFEKQILYKTRIIRELKLALAQIDAKGIQNTTSSVKNTFCYSPLSDSKSNEASLLQSPDTKPEWQPSDEKRTVKQLEVCEKQSKVMLARNTVLIDNLIKSESSVKVASRKYRECEDLKLEERESSLRSAYIVLYEAFNMFQRIVSGELIDIPSTED